MRATRGTPETVSPRQAGRARVVPSSGTMSQIHDVPVRLPIRLGQFLKLSGLVDTGAEASDLIAGHHVEVDGTIETRRGRQLAGGEVVVVARQSHRTAARVVGADA